MKSLENNHLGGCIVNDNVGDINTWCPCLWDKLVELTQAKTMVDVGCGVGYSLKYFSDKGLSVVGIDGLDSVIEYSPIPEKIIIHDYTKDTYILDTVVDFAWSCEFVEHIEEKFVNNFMETFTKCRYVGMTHALPGQVGYHHVNCQSPEYWIDKFRKYGFDYIESESKILKECLIGKHYGHWVRNSFMLFKNNNIL